MRNAKRLDDLDRAILLELRADARLSNVELARRVGLTPAPCLRRVKRLEDDGVIAGYRARIDPEASGRPLTVLLSVEISMTRRQTVEEFESTVAGYDEVTEMRRLFGVPDYLIRVEVADAAAYERFQTEKLAAHPALHRIVSHQTMKVVKALD
ncbi:Lrp/AsnC family transcriptional regulator [Williamsia sp. MIQD14]|uniref:Lrp/AsnC family transcriptional regulator n=1 Tax=Williamsia sp. MIQD14 TaxID=3425703 RepID=UPI003DA0113B